MEVKEFLSAALPLVLAGIALAVLAASCSTKEHRSKVSGTNIAMGASLGLLLGVTLNSCGLWENHAIGLALGPLWGMALGSLFRRDERNDT
ncbi:MULTISPECIES: hypothetical protein [unclassified Ruminococcus]|uniref:hypothetical protein n=1 Tax=unclassified Ruminococcus TaxID=2608920 RepID=UPI0021093AC2|nr:MULTISPECIES: hypothetical protein [unclassified Ruminococcus]MCQ4022375.1 hypothetical protein [Ruminococcus sp. zg-924]MCQ4114703.1 hypothetical protein [Ruminococcus sp. zg-921]